MAAAESALRQQSWNVAMAASPGALDLRVAAADVDGEVPEVLRGGRLLSNGPGWTVIGGRTAHPFDGHGYVRSFRFTHDGGLELRARFVQTPTFAAERKAGKLVHRGLATNVSDHFWENLGVGPRRNVANTTVTRWGDRLLAGWEAGVPYSLELESLETRGEDHFGGVLEGKATLAHMRKDRDRLVLCSLEQARHATFTFREVDEDDQVCATHTAQLDGMVFAHDYALTPKWFILGSNPLRLRPWQVARTLLGSGTLLESIATDLRKPGELCLVSREDGGELRRVQLPGPLFIVHFGNAFERDGELIVDVCAFSDVPFGEEFGFTGPHSELDLRLPERRGPQRLLRIRVPAGGDGATWEPLTPFGVDFPRFHPDHEGRETPMLYGATRRDIRFSDPFDSLIGVDLVERTRPDDLWTAPDNVFVGEPVYVPTPGTDRGGHVVAILSDGLSRRTFLTVFDALNIAGGPLARVGLPLLPVAFHGDWEPVAG